MYSQVSKFSLLNIAGDLVSGLVVFLVAVPLCMGIALASGANLFAGLLSGIIGGTVVALISGSHTSISGPAAALTTIVAAQIAGLGSFEAFSLAVVIAGLIQIAFGLARGGALSAFIPSSVVKGLLVAIGVILILKQIPHVVGHDSDPEGEMSFQQPDHQTTFTELLTTFAGDIQTGAMVIGLVSIVALVVWDRIPALKKSVIPAPLVVVLLGTGMSFWFSQLGSPWEIKQSHLVQIPIAKNAAEFIGFLRIPNFTQLSNPAVYVSAFTLAIVASLATLMNLEAVDKIDLQKRKSPSSRELVAQGCGNIVSGMIGGLPVTSEIVRGGVNINAGAKTKLSAIVHGVLLLVSVAFLPKYMNMIPLSALAAILLVTGFKLASPQLFKQMWQEGRYQFIPFMATLIAIVMTDLLIGILIGLGIAVLFILNSNLRRPIRRVVEHHLAGDIIRVELANQVSFLNRAAIERLFNSLRQESRLLIDASDSDYIDPDVLSLIRDFRNNVAPRRGVHVNLRGFKTKYLLQDDDQFANHTTRALQEKVLPDQVIEILRNGNKRFVDGTRINRDLGRQVDATAAGQNPIAAILSCIDSRVPTELVFDLGVGDIFSVRVAGNVIGTKSLGSLEYAVGVAGVKLVLVMGHTRCGAVTSSIKLVAEGLDAESATGCQHLQAIVDEIAVSVSGLPKSLELQSAEEAEILVDEIAKRNVLHTAAQIMQRSNVIHAAALSEQLKVLGAMYDVKSGNVEFFELEKFDKSRENFVSNKT